MFSLFINRYTMTAAKIPTITVSLKREINLDFASSHLSFPLAEAMIIVEISLIPKSNKPIIPEGKNNLDNTIKPSPLTPYACIKKGTKTNPAKLEAVNADAVKKISLKNFCSIFL